MIVQLMHGSEGREHVAQYASEGWLDQLRNGIPQFAPNGEPTDPLEISFQCLGCSRIVRSDDVTDGEPYEEEEA